MNVPMRLIVRLMCLASVSRWQPRLQRSLRLDATTWMNPVVVMSMYSRTVRWEDHARCDLVDTLELDSVPVEEILEGVDEPGAEASDDSSSADSVEHEDEPSTDTEATVEESTSE